MPCPIHRPATFLLACGLALAVPAFPQGTGEGSASAFDNWTFEPGGSVTLVLAPGRGEAGNGLPDAEPVLGEVSLDAALDRFLDNGAQIGARFALRFQADHPARPGFAGMFTPAGLPAQGGGFSAPAAGGSAPDEGVRGGLERAYVFIDGGYGELVIGRDIGVARRFHEGAPDAFTFARADTSLLDPSGLALVRTINDASGPSAKLSYASPRIIGFRAGISLTPDAGEARGLDRDAGARGLGALAPRPAEAAEAAISFSRIFGESGTRFSASLSVSHIALDAAALAIPGALVGDVRTYGLGAELELTDWTFGASLLSSDDGLADGDYEAFSIGAERRFGDWRLAASYGRAEDGRLGLEGESYSIGAAREVTGYLDFAVGWRQDDLQAAPGTSADSGGIVIEITLRR